MAYAREFGEARACSAFMRFKLPPLQQIELTKEKKDRINRLFETLREALGADGLAYRCLGHAALLDAVEAAIGGVPTLTVGYLTVGEMDYYYCSRRDMREWLRQGVPDTTGAPVHAWLTLPTRRPTVLDFTLDATWRTAKQTPLTPDALRGYLLGTAFESVNYHPVAAGNDIPARLGVRTPPEFLELAVRLQFAA